MNDLLSLLVLALVSASLYAVAASGLVVTYQTSGIFNFAHGAVAMFCAFTYWQLSSPDAGSLPMPLSIPLRLVDLVLPWDVPYDGPLPVPIALALTLLVVAPGMGYLIDRLLMRRLHDATPIARIVVPIGLLVALIQLATIVWSPEKARTLPRFFAGSSVELGGIVVEYHQLVVFAVAVGVAIGLRILLYGTRIGVAMRAVVESRDLAALNGASADRVSSISWALGCSLAGLAGVLIAPILTLDQTQLTLLVINAYAAAMVGRLRSLPLTAVGALVLGLAREAASRYDDSLPDWISVDTVPALMLFAVLILVPQDKEDLFGRQKDRSRVPNPNWPTIGIGAVAFVALAAALPEITRFLAESTDSLQPGTTLGAVGYGLALGVVALSLVPLTGYAGQISLAPLAFAGVGAVVMYQFGEDGNPLALIAVAVICAAVGAVVALPALRLKGLYLALATFAFALFCEKAIFTEVDQFSDSNADYRRLGFGGFRAESDRANLIVMAIIFVAIGAGVLAMRKGSLGRQLQAMKDSPAACATLGVNTTRLKLQVFALSAAIAGIGGALLGGWRQKAGLEQFAMLQGNLPGLPLVLLTVVGGIASVAGSMLGAMLLAAFPLVGSAFPAVNNLMQVLPGLAGISLANNPDGAIAQAIAQVRAKRERRARRAAGEIDEPNVVVRAAAFLARPAPALVPEAIPVGGSVSEADIQVLDEETGLDWGRCHGDPRNA